MPVGDWQLPADYLRAAYSSACEAVGLLPVLLPVTDDNAVRDAQLDAIDGLILTGGLDIHPRFYGECELHPETEATEERRDAHELALARAAVARDLPVFGICRGLQLLNVALGGTLHQHLPNHRQEPHTSETAHPLRLAPGSRLSRILGDADMLAVNSHHHQAACSGAPGLLVSARDEDGVVEALEKPDARFVLAVQWHPENLFAADTASRALFAAFAAAL